MVQADYGPSAVRVLFTGAGCEPSTNLIGVTFPNAVETMARKVASCRLSDAHHLRFTQNRALGRKVSDEFTVPLYRGHHREVHRCGDEAS